MKEALKALEEIEKTTTLCYTDTQRHIFIQGYKAKNSNSKLELFLPLAKNLSRTQIKNIVESNMKAIRRKKNPKRSFWSWLLGNSLPNTGGVFDLKEFE